MASPKKIFKFKKVRKQEKLKKNRSKGTRAKLKKLEREGAIIL